MAGKEDDDDRKRKYKIPTYVYDPYHINVWTGDFLFKRQNYSAAIKQYNAAENNVTVDAEMVPIYQGRSRAYLHTWNLKSTGRDVEEGVLLRPNNVNYMRTLGDMFYQWNRFEDALGVHLRGHYKKPTFKEFEHGMHAARGTVLNVLGAKVGDVMSSKRLGDVLVNMKKKELGLTHIDKGQNEIARRRKMKKIKRIKDSYDEIYLGRAAKDASLMENLLHENCLFLANKKQNKFLRKNLEDTLYKLNAAKIALWERKPLYTREHDVLSKRVKEFTEKKQERKRKDLDIVVNMRIAALERAYNREDYTDCFNKGGELRSFLFEQSERDFPGKQDAMLTVITILGDLLIRKKTLLPNESADENDNRLMVLFGFRKPKTLNEEIYSEQGFHPKIVKLKKFLDSKLSDLQHTTDSMERAYLCHEIGVAYSFKDIPYLTRKYARKAIFASKDAKDQKWIINSTFLLARAEIQQGDMNQGRVCLNGLIAAATKFNYTNIKYLATRAYEFTTMPQSGTEIGSDMNEPRILKAMFTTEQKFQAKKLFDEAKRCPPDERFPPLKLFLGRATLVKPSGTDDENVYHQALREARRRTTLDIGPFDDNTDE